MWFINFVLNNLPIFSIWSWIGFMPGQFCPFFCLIFNKDYAPRQFCPFFYWILNRVWKGITWARCVIHKFCSKQFAHFFYLILNRIHAWIILSIFYWILSRDYVPGQFCPFFVWFLIRITRLDNFVHFFIGS